MDERLSEVLGKRVDRQELLAVREFSLQVVVTLDERGTITSSRSMCLDGEPLLGTVRRCHIFFDGQAPPSYDETKKLIKIHHPHELLGPLQELLRQGRSVRASYGEYQGGAAFAWVGLNGERPG